MEASFLKECLLILGIIWANRVIFTEKLVYVSFSKLKHSGFVQNQLHFFCLFQNVLDSCKVGFKMNKIENKADWIQIMEDYLCINRPPLNIRSEIDLGYEIQKQSIILFEVRPIWNEPSKVLNEPYAKATYIKKSDRWKVYWMRGNLQWFSYGPKPEV